MFFQILHTLAEYQRIEIAGTDVHPPNAAFHQCFGAGRLLAVVTAWLQCDIHGRTGRILRAVLQGVSFCVQVTIAGMPALADDAVIFDDHSTYQRIGIGKAGATLGKLYGTLHVKRMLCHENTSEK